MKITTRNEDIIVLYRLLRKLKDGFFEIVGFEKHRHAGDTISICHIRNLGDKTLFSTRINHRGIGAYIKHDRKDQYTGTEIGGIKCFQRDKIQYKGINAKGVRGKYTKIVLDPFRLYGRTLEYISWLDMRNMINLYGIDLKIVGIEGVKE